MAEERSRLRTLGPQTRTDHSRSCTDLKSELCVPFNVTGNGEAVYAYAVNVPIYFKQSDVREAKQKYNNMVV